MRKIYGDACDDRALKLNKPSLAFDKNKDFEEQKINAKKAFRQLLCMQKIEDNSADALNTEIETIEDKGDYTQIRLRLKAKRNVSFPVTC